MREVYRPSSNHLRRVIPITTAILTSRKLLRRAQEFLNPEIIFAGAVETLRGPLGPFALSQEKTIKESLVSPQEREKEKQKGDWRQKRKELAVDIGLYKLEELVL